MKKALIWILQWVVVPVAVAAVGFYVLGPYVGRVPKVNYSSKLDGESHTEGSEGPATGSTDPEKQPEAAKPKSSVTVEGEVKRRRNKNHRAEVETVTPGRPKPEDLDPTGSDSPNKDPGTTEGEPDTGGSAPGETPADGAQPETSEPDQTNP